MSGYIQHDIGDWLFKDDNGQHAIAVIKDIPNFNQAIDDVKELIESEGTSFQRVRVWKLHASLMPPEFNLFPGNWQT